MAVPLFATTRSRFGTLSYDEVSATILAKVGANAVVLGSRSTETQVVGIPSYGTQGGTMIPSSDSEVVQGIAVYVEK